MENRLQYQKIALRKVDYRQADKDFIASLFRVPDIRTYFTLRDDHAANIYSFVEYLADMNMQNRCINFIIEDEWQTPVGLLTAELYQDPRLGEIAWNIGYAVHTPYRNQGYAKNAVQALHDYLTKFNIDYMVLDISTDNESARAVARDNGFEQQRSETGGLVGFFDKEHPELGMRTRWVKKVHDSDPRTEDLLNATAAYKRKDYREAIRYYNAALGKPYKKGSIATDAIIYSNLGMAHSSLREYRTAYMYLTKAWNMGCQNPTISKELEWLRTNAANEI